MSNIFNMLKVVDFDKKISKYWYYLVQAIFISCIVAIFSIFSIVLFIDILVSSIFSSYFIWGVVVLTISVYLIYALYSVLSENKALTRKILLKSDKKDTVFDVYTLKHKVFENLDYNDFILLNNKFYEISDDYTSINELNYLSVNIIDGRLFYNSIEFKLDRRVVVPNNSLKELYVIIDTSNIESHLDSYINFNYMSHNEGIFEKIGITEDNHDFLEILLIITDDNSLCVKNIHEISENFYRVSYHHTGDKLYIINDKNLISLSSVKQMNYFNKENELIVYFEDNDKSPIEIEASYDETKLLAGLLSLKGSVFSS